MPGPLSADHLAGSDHSSPIKDAIRYEPGDFLQKSKINEQLKAGTQLGEQQMIMFNEKEIQD